MAMDGDSLGDEIAECIMASDAPDHMKVQIRKMWRKIGGVIVKHIQDNAEVSVDRGIAVANLGTQQAPNYATVEEGSGKVS